VLVLLVPGLLHAWTVRPPTIISRPARPPHRFLLLAASSSSQHSTAPSPSSVSLPVDEVYHVDYEIGSANLPGTDPDRPQKVNQDAHFAFQGTTQVEESRSRSITVLGVLDGHGLKGHQLTDFLQAQLPQRLRQYLKLSSIEQHDTEEEELPPPDNNNDNMSEFTRLLRKQRNDIVELGNANPSELEDDDPIAQALIDAFLAAHLDARRAEGVPTGRSGTTCVVCVLVEDHDNNCLTVYTASVGDSGAILTTISPRTGLNTRSLATASTVDIPEERARIERSKGRVDASGNVFIGPVGIAMTRSLGDTVLLPAGVIPVPIVTKHELTTKEANTTYYVCAATDGVFDVLKNARVAAIITRTASVAVTSITETSESDGETAATGAAVMDAAALEVCSQAKQAWLGDLPVETKVDDISCVIAKCTVAGGADATP